LVSRANAAGGSDNATVVVVDVIAVSPASEPESVAQPASKAEG
jgi:serine/threonine protein phosphatase PrpC